MFISYISTGYKFNAYSIYIVGGFSFFRIRFNFTLEMIKADAFAFQFTHPPFIRYG